MCSSRTRTLYSTHHAVHSLASRQMPLCPARTGSTRTQAGRCGTHTSRARTPSLDALIVSCLLYMLDTTHHSVREHRRTLLHKAESVEPEVRLRCGTDILSVDRVRIRDDCFAMPARFRGAEMCRPGALTARKDGPGRTETKKPRRRPRTIAGLAQTVAHGSLAFSRRTAFPTSVLCRSRSLLLAFTLVLVTHAGRAALHSYLHLPSCCAVSPSCSSAIL
jgi:hypothetical protein